MAPHSANRLADGEMSMKTNLRSIPALKGPFREVDLGQMPDTPHDSFRLWLNDATASGVKEPHAMTVSTVDKDGFPDARVLILKNLDSRGWHFGFKAESPKGQQIAANGQVALTFYWPDLGRQVRIRGKAVQLSDAECAQDFLERPVASRISAVASKQSQAFHIADNTEMDQRLAAAETQLKGDPEYVDPEWKVYAVAPTCVEFWQGATDRRHKRLRYVKDQRSEAWRKERLWP